MAAAVTLALVGCSASRTGHPAGSAAVGPPPAVGLATAATSGSGGSWATLPVRGPDGSTASYWQLLVRPAGTARWRLATPPGVADNAGLVVTGSPGGGLTAGFVPADLLTFTPLAVTSTGGARWSQELLPDRLAGRPDALTSLPQGALIAVTTTAAELSGPGGAHWAKLVTRRALAATAAGRRCGLLRLAGAAVAPGGVPLLAGECSRPGRTGIFRKTASGWALDDVPVPSSVRGARITVLRLVTTATGPAALLAATGKRGTVLIPVWWADGSGRWMSGAPFSVGRAAARTVSVVGSGGWAVVLGNARAVLITGGHGRYLPGRLPAPDAMLVASATMPPTALVPGAASVVVWQFTGGHWQRVQAVGIPTGV